MRITNSMLITNMLANLNSNLRLMSRKQDELSTGKRVINASDDPVGAAKIMKFKADLADMAQYSTNVRDAQAWMDASEASISEAGTILQRVRELAVQAANGTNTVSDTQKMKEEIVQLKSHLISGANANFAGRYLFSSHYTDRPVLDAQGNYSIPITKKDTVDPEVAVYEVSVAETMKVGTHAFSYLKGEIDQSAYARTMPTAISTNGTAASKPTVSLTVNLNIDYSAGSDIDITVAGKTFRVDKTKLVGSVLTPLTTGKVVNALNVAGRLLPGPPDSLDQLSTYADVFYDQTGVLKIKGKAFGVANTVEVQTPIPAGIIVSGLNPASGSDSVAASVTSSGIITNADVSSFANKKFLMTYDGVTKEFQIQAAPVIASVASLVTNLQGMMDDPYSGFGPGKITVAGFDGGSLSFTSITPALAEKTPKIEVASVLVSKPKLVKDLDDLIAAMGTGVSGDISKLIGELDIDIDNLLAVRADLGARGSRLELIDSRITENNITFTRLLSDSQDADMSEVIMFLKNAENVYKAALSVGGRIIQPTLTDFLR